MLIPECAGKAVDSLMKAGESILCFRKTGTIAWDVVFADICVLSSVRSRKHPVTRALPPEKGQQERAWNLLAEIAVAGVAAIGRRLH